MKIRQVSYQDKRKQQSFGSVLLGAQTLPYKLLRDYRLAHDVRLFGRLLAKDGNNFRVFVQHDANIPELIESLDYNGIRAKFATFFDLCSHVNPQIARGLGEKPSNLADAVSVANAFKGVVFNLLALKPPVSVAPKNFRPVNLELVSTKSKPVNIDNLKYLVAYCSRFLKMPDVRNVVIERYLKQQDVFLKLGAVHALEHVDNVYDSVDTLRKIADDDTADNILRAEAQSVLAAIYKSWKAVSEKYALNVFLDDGSSLRGESIVEAGERPLVCLISIYNKIGAKANFAPLNLTSPRSYCY